PPHPCSTPGHGHLPSLPAVPTRRSSDLDRVVLTLQPSGSSAQARALDPEGGVVATGSASQGPDPVDIVLSGQDIATVELTGGGVDRKSTRLNCSQQIISYAVFCL